MLYPTIFDKFAQDYDNITKEWTAPQVVSSLLIKHILNKGKKDILDIGVGTGKSSKQLCYLGYNIVGVDLSFKMLKEIEKRGLDIKLVQADLKEGLPFFDNKFDCVVSCGLFEFIEDYKSALEEITRVTSKNGLVTFTFETCNSNESKKIELAPNYIIYRRSEKELIEYISINYKILESFSFIAYQRPNHLTGNTENIHFLAGILEKF